MTGHKAGFSFFWPSNDLRFSSFRQTRKDLVEVVSSLGCLPGLKTLGITTNGIVLGRKLEELVRGGLNSVNISLDTLCR